MAKIIQHFRVFENGYIEVWRECQELLGEKNGYRKILSMYKAWDGKVSFGNTPLSAFDGPFEIGIFFPDYKGEAFLKEMSCDFDVIHFIGSSVLMYKGEAL